MIYTIGHSNHSVERFIALLTQHAVDTVVDVRSIPYSSYITQFNSEALKADLGAIGISYLFLGKELGARPADRSCYVAGRVHYELLAKSQGFGEGLDRLMRGMQSRVIALMCAEKEPMDCHRAILVARELVARGVNVHHILGSGEAEDHKGLLQRLRTKHRLPEQDLFRSLEDINNEAYERQGARIAYVEPTDGNTSDNEDG